MIFIPRPLGRGCQQWQHHLHFIMWNSPLIPLLDSFVKGQGVVGQKGGRHALKEAIQSIHVQTLFKNDMLFVCVYVCV